MRTIADPGVGRDDDPIGSKGWAERVRLRMQGIVNDVDTKPDALRRYVDLVKQHRAWTLMSTPDGGVFKTWEEFCEYRQPWGLGKKWETLRPYVEAVVGKAATQLATVSPAQSPPGTKGSQGALSTHTDKRLRAILRAPEEVQELYKAGAISQKVAAKLGPKKPTGEQMSKIAEVVIALRDAPRERKAVDAKVRDVLGMRRDAVSEVVRAFLRLDAKQRRRFYDEVEKATKG